MIERPVALDKCWCILMVDDSWKYLSPLRLCTDSRTWKSLDNHEPLLELKTSMTYQLPLERSTKVSGSAE